MATLHTEKPSRGTLSLRIKQDLRGLIDRAAELAGKNRTDFVLDAARQAAEDALMDRTVFSLDKKAWDAFVARLDAKPQPNAKLRKTLKAASPWAK
jgi:uncharacterized protein (DUF1778 family)